MKCFFFSPGVAKNLLCLIPNVTSRMTDSSSDHHPTFGSSCRFLWDGLTVCTCSASNTAAAMLRPYSQMGPTSIFPGLPTDSYLKGKWTPQVTWLTAVLRCGCIWVVVMLHALLGFVYKCSILCSRTFLKVSHVEQHIFSTPLDFFYTVIVEKAMCSRHILANI